MVGILGTGARGRDGRWPIRRDRFRPLIRQSVTVSRFGVSYRYGSALDSWLMSMYQTTVARCLVLMPAAIAWLILLPCVAEAWPGTTPAVAAAGGGKELGTGCEDLSAEPITYGMMYDIPESGLPQSIRDIHDIWLAGGCVGCHQLNSAMNGGLLLNDPGFAAPQLFFPSSRDSSIYRVVEGRPEDSLTYAMLNCVPPQTFPAMPPAVDGISQRIARPLRAMVYDWIAQGARGVDGDGNPIRVFVNPCGRLYAPKLRQSA